VIRPWGLCLQEWISVLPQSELLQVSVAFSCSLAWSFSWPSTFHHEMTQLGALTRLFDLGLPSLRKLRSKCLFITNYPVSHSNHSSKWMYKQIVGTPWEGRKYWNMQCLRWHLWLLWKKSQIKCCLHIYRHLWNGESQCTMTAIGSLVAWGSKLQREIHSKAS
jgi:hypothetical protein